jgi:PadR family transcriptional regulator PadR
MPRGKGWGRRRRARAHGIRRFAEPCLLLLLHRDDGHGYDLLEQLQDMGFGQENLDSSVVYRYLREMEARGFVTSTWDTEGAGPPRRVYRLTSDGDEYLARWISHLRSTRETLDRFLHAYDDHMNQEDGNTPTERIEDVDIGIPSQESLETSR